MLRVSDEGHGFPPDFLPHAFERFSRADAARTDGGAGLGLAIVDAVARAHGGQRLGGRRDRDARPPGSSASHRRRLASVHEGKILLLVLVALAAGCGADERPALPQGSDPVEIDPADFSTEIDNPYWPMQPGSTWVYREGDQRVEVTVTDRTRTVMGVETRVVHDLVTENGVPVEDTFDWYAQDADGNIWYFGEDTTEFKDGKPVGHEGAWEAGVDGAQPGIVLPAEPGGRA